MTLKPLTENTKSERFPARSPRRIDNLSWFYEERKGLFVVAETRLHLDGERVVTRQVTIPWRLLCNAVDRYRRAKAKRK
jgi:hypothetical protein